MPHVHDFAAHSNHHHGSSPRASAGAATLADVAAVARTRRARRGGCCLLFPAVPLLAAAALVAGAVLWALYTPKAIDATRGLLRLLETQGRAGRPLPPPDYANPTRWTRDGTFEAIVVGIAARAQVGGTAAIISLAGVALLSAVLTVAGGVAERRSGIGSGSRGGGNCCSSLRAAAGAHGALAFISWLAMAGFVALFALYAAWLGSAVVGDVVLGASGSFASLLQQAAGGAALADAAAAAAGGGGAATATCEPDCVALLGAATAAADTLPSAFLAAPISSSDPAIRCLCSAAGLRATKAAARAVAASVGPALAGVALLAAAASWLYGGSTAGCARTGATAEMAREWDKMAAEAEAVAAAGGAGAGAFGGGYSAGGIGVVNGGGLGGGGGTGAGAYAGNGALEGRAPAASQPQLGGGGFNGSFAYYEPPPPYGQQPPPQQQHRLANGSGGSGGASAWAVEEAGGGGDASAAATAALRRAVTGTTTPRYG